MTLDKIHARDSDLEREREEKIIEENRGKAALAMNLVATHRDSVDSEARRNLHVKIQALVGSGPGTLFDPDSKTWREGNLIGAILDPRNGDFLVVGTFRDDVQREPLLQGYTLTADSPDGFFTPVQDASGRLRPRFIPGGSIPGPAW